MVASRLMMRRRSVTLSLLSALAALFLSGCAKKTMVMPDLFPETAGAWHRTTISDPAAAGNPDHIEPETVEKVRAATYEGPGKLEVRAYQVTTPAVALEIVQRWNATPDTVLFNQDRFVVVLKWQNADRKALQEFVAVIDGKLHRNK